MVRIPFDRDKIADFCRLHHIRKLSFFGSVLRDDFTPESDVDVLVEFEPGKTPGLAFFSMDAGCPTAWGGLHNGAHPLRDVPFRRSQGKPWGTRQEDSGKWSCVPLT